MKKYFPDFIGNDALKERIGCGIMKNDLSHAFLIEGDAGTGKHTFALSFAAALACEGKDDSTLPLPCGKCPSCKKILSGNSPDVIRISRGEKATLGVDAVRGLKSDVYIAPNDLQTKVYIIEDAHLMTVQAQNAFLLTLEEPPAYVLFFLLCERVSPLLETVRSRAQLLRLRPVPMEEIDNFLCRNREDAVLLKRSVPDEYKELLAAANGSVGQAISLLDPKLRSPILTQRKCAREFATLCLGSHNHAAVLSFLNGLGQKREPLIRQLNGIQLCLCDLLLCKQSESAPLCFFADREEAHELAYRFTTPELLRLCNCVSDAVDQLNRNANVRLTLTLFGVSAGLL